MRRKDKEAVKVVVADPKAVAKQARVDKVTRMVAIAFVFASTFYFFIKLLFL